MTKINSSPGPLKLTPDYPETPYVSIVLPVYNEQTYIVRCLAAIQKQDYPADSLEILVIDGFSTDDTRRLVSLAAVADTRVKLLDNLERLQAHGLNYGIKAAHGQIIIRVDGHVLIAPDYVSQCVRLLREMANQAVVNVGGPMRPHSETNVGRAIAAATQSPFGIPTAFHHSTRAQFVDTVYLGAWPHTLFEQIGGFNPALSVNEDYEFNYRTRSAGGKIYLSPNIRSVYFCRSSYPALWRQYYIYGRQKVQMLRRYPESVKVRQLVAPVFVAALVGLPVLAVFVPSLGLLWLFMLLAYFGAGSVAAWKSPRNGTSLFTIVLAFLVMHVAWGSGFWRGLSITLYQRQTGARGKITRSQQQKGP